jgi:hypothetical protein
MILDDAFERFSQKYPMSVMARGIVENALNPRDPRSALFDDVAEKQFEERD